MQLTDFERKVLTHLISGEADVALLQRQLERASVGEREFTGPGVFVTLEIPADLPRLKPDRLHFITGNPNPLLKHPRLEYDAMAVLFIHEGAIHCLEMVTYTHEDWPRDDNLFEIGYSKRDMQWQ